MKEAFINKAFSGSSLELITIANTIIDQYREQGYRLTLRQLYYQFVARDLLANTEANYKRLGNVIANARMAGLVDWSAIEDRGRALAGWQAFDSARDFLAKLRDRFMVDLLEGQDTYVEVWVEKAALEGVISRACEELRVPHFACRGYTSATAAYEAGKRFERRIEGGQRVVVLHLGDHDPSGLDMTRDNRERSQMFAWSEEVEVRRIALNMDQIEQYAPPPNPTKVTDSRAGAYLDAFGSECWELDALDPDVLVNLVRSHLEALIDYELVRERQAYEAEEEERIDGVIAGWEG